MGDLVASGKFYYIEFSGGAIAPTGRRPESRLGAIRANPLGSATQLKMPTLRGRFYLRSSAWT